METRVCNRCNKRKPLSEYHKNGVDKETGAQRYRLECKTCYRAHRIANKKSFTKFANNTKHRTGEVTTVLTYEQWKACLVHFEGKCAYCGAEQTRRHKHTKEHIVPVASGGNSSVSNIVVACTRCNSSKQDRPMEQWYTEQVFFSEQRLQRIKEWIAKWKTS